MNFTKSFMRSVRSAAGQRAKNKEPHVHFKKAASSKPNTPPPFSMARSIALGALIGGVAAVGHHMIFPPNFHLLPPPHFSPSSAPGPKPSTSANRVALDEMGERIRGLRFELNQLLRRPASGNDLKSVQSQHACMLRILNEVASMESRAWEVVVELAGPHLRQNPQVQALVQENAGLLQQCQPLDVVLANIVSLASARDPSPKVIEAYVNGGLARKRNEQLKYARNVYDMHRPEICELVLKLEGGKQLLSRIERLDEMAAQRTIESHRCVRDTVNELGWIVMVHRKTVRASTPPGTRPGYSSVGKPLEL